MAVVNDVRIKQKIELKEKRLQNKECVILQDNMYELERIKKVDTEQRMH